MIAESYGIGRETNAIAHNYMQMATIIKPHASMPTLKTVKISAVVKETSVALPSKLLPQQNNKRLIYPKITAKNKSNF